jgi:hypothetical protein
MDMSFFFVAGGIVFHYSTNVKRPNLELEFTFILLLHIIVDHQENL